MPYQARQKGNPDLVTKYADYFESMSPLDAAADISPDLHPILHPICTRSTPDGTVG
jgi:hypothetical protein